MRITVDLRLNNLCWITKENLWNFGLHVICLTCRGFRYFVEPCAVSRSSLPEQSDYCCSIKPLNRLPECQCLSGSFNWFSQMDWKTGETCSVVRWVHASVCFEEKQTLGPPCQRWKRPSRLLSVKGTKASICDGMEMCQWSQHICDGATVTKMLHICFF